MGIDPKGLQIGQTVTVQERLYGVQINTPEEGETGLTVIEVGQEHLVLGDSAGGTRMSIPLFLIHKTATASVESIDAAWVISQRQIVPMPPCALGARRRDRRIIRDCKP